MSEFVFEGNVVRWVDGDTVKLKVWKQYDFGFDIVFKVMYSLTCRVYGIDTPEDNAGKPATAKVNELAPVDSEVSVETFKPHNQDKYGRWLAQITTPSGINIAAELISLHLGVPYFGGKKE